VHLRQSWATVFAAVISDLHLGTRTRAELLSRPEVRARLLEALDRADEVVLLGDSIELRDDALPTALERALPFFADLGEMLGERPLTIVPGNHDHRLTRGWLRPDGRIGLEERAEVGPGHPLAPVVRAMGSVPVTLAYPGVWLRPDVYATHGHYLDCHSNARTFESRACEVTKRVRRLPRDGFRTPADYEAALAPIYGLIHWSLQAPGVRGAAHGAKALIRRWERPRVDRSARVRPGVAAMNEVVRNLGVDAQHVIFGHLHRPGRWQSDSGPELINSGGWVRDASSESPGNCVFVREQGIPQLAGVL
jgi:UDP-2,3-diacylglucosamine pyrophosphatase LpxH